MIKASVALLVALVLVPGVAGAVPTPSPIEAAHPYPMTCNLGGATNALTIISGGIDKIAFSVSKGPAAAGLAPGQCAFDDRAVRSTEPTSLCFTGAQETNMTYKGLAVTSGGFNTTPGGKLAQALIFGGSSQFWTFSVMNTTTCFSIVSFGV